MDYTEIIESLYKVYPWKVSGKLLFLMGNLDEEELSLTLNQNEEVCKANYQVGQSFLEEKRTKPEANKPTQNLIVKLMLDLLFIVLLYTDS